MVYYSKMVKFSIIVVEMAHTYVLESWAIFDRKVFVEKGVVACSKRQVRMHIWLDCNHRIFHS